MSVEPAPLPVPEDAPPVTEARATTYRPLPQGRFTGPMPFLVAVMLFLMLLASALAIGLGHATSALGDAIEGRVTVQVMQADPVRREIESDRAVAELRRLAGVRRVERVEDAQLVRLLEPWLGRGGVVGGDLPLPAMIDVDLAPGEAWRVGTVAKALKEVAPSARIDDHAAALAPLASALGTLGWLAGAIVLLTASATVLVVVLATRSALETHAPTIEVLHLLGATDRQVAGLFQRRVVRDALWGALGGAGLAVLVILLLGSQLGRLGSELAGSAGLGIVGWGVLILLPFAAALLARVATGLTVLRVLSRVP